MGPDHRPGINSIVCIYIYMRVLNSWEFSIQFPFLFLNF